MYNYKKFLLCNNKHTQIAVETNNFSYPANKMNLKDKINAYCTLNFMPYGILKI